MRGKTFIEEHLCKALNLMMVTVPLIVDTESGVNDLLDRDGSRTPIQFHISNDRDQNPVDAQIVQAATKWKRVALQRFDMRPGEGLCTDMRAIRKDYFLDHDHSVYVDQWDWEKVIHFYEHDLDFLKQTVNAIWKVLVDAEDLPPGSVPRAQESATIRTCRRSSPSYTPRMSSTCTPTCRENSAKPGCCRSALRSS